MRNKTFSYWYVGAEDKADYPGFSSFLIAFWNNRLLFIRGRFFFMELNHKDSCMYGCTSCFNSKPKM